MHHNPATLPASLDPFTITTSTGFLPLHHPVTYLLPAAFAPMLKLAAEFPIVKKDGTQGLLATYQLGSIIEAGGLPNLTSEIDNLVAENGKPDLAAVTAVFRDYAFIASAYLLEPCWERWNNDHDGGYGLGREMLPACIAGPLVKTADLLGIPPFMSYAAAYSLYNYELADPTLGTSEYSNLRLVRAFEKGLDPKSSEAGFVLTHVHMVEKTAPLINGAVSLLSTIEDAPANTDAVHRAFNTMLSAMEKIEASMENMWSHSLPKDYNSYRTFIFGITNQSMFPDGVVYEGVNENKAMFFRGESGANDSIIPLLDHLLEITSLMPQNPLTEILKDFRSYRPKPHREFLAWVLSKSAELGVRAYCCGGSDVETTVLYLRLLDHVRSFRWRHWLFAREYIIRRSKHPTATGGSPIVTWLPNQLFAVMDLMLSTYEGVENSQA